MANISKLLELNSQLGLLNDVYQDTNDPFRNSTLSNYIQIAVRDVFRWSQDKSLFSLDIERLADTDELRAELNPARFNFVSSLQLENIHQALEINEDFGGVAHYLSSKVGNLDSIKQDVNRARLSMLRCANKRNVCHISEDLEKINFPENHYDLIVLSALEMLDLDKEELQSLFAKLRNALTANGVLVLNARNNQRLASWLNADNANGSDSEADAAAFQELYHRHEQHEWQRQELSVALAAAGLSSFDFHATFSAGENCHNLFSEDYLTSSVNALNHFYRLGAFGNANLNEYLLVRSLLQQKRRLFDLASRYLVLAGSSRQVLRQIYDNDFTHYAGQSRQPQWRAHTSRRRGARDVEKIALHPNHPSTSRSSSVVVSQDLSPQPFEKGALLIDDWLQAILDKNIYSFECLVKEYYEWLLMLSKQQDFSQFAYDLLPFNVLVKQRGDTRSLIAIDPEWKIKGDLRVDTVLFRALFWFAFENKSLLKPFAAEADLDTLGLFVLRFMPNAVALNDLDAHIEFEEAAQLQITKSFRAGAVAHALLQTFDQSQENSDSEARCQIAWSDAEGKVDEQNSRFALWNARDEAETMRIQLPPQSKGRTLLRIDPIATRGIFRISQLELRQSNREPIESLQRPLEDDARVELHNMRAIDDGAYIALNSDPYLTFDLSNTEQIKSATEVKLSFQLLHDEHYDVSLATLTDALQNQSNVLVQQANRLNQYRSERDFLEMRLDDAIEHRLDLRKIANEQKRVLSQINERLTAQLERNEEMEGFLMMRPSTRIKRIVTRNLAKFGIGEQEIVTHPQTASTAGDDAGNNEQSNSVGELDQFGLPANGEIIGQNIEDYQLWIEENTMSEGDVAQAKVEIESWDEKPVFSILVPVYNTDPEYLIAMIRSVQAQIYPHWQLCLVDDCSPKGYLKSVLEYEAAQDERIKIQLNDYNQGISMASNDAVALAEGDFIALLDHDDELSQDALYQNAKAIVAKPDLCLIYSDEDKMDMQGNRLEPYFKPDYSPDLLDTNNYICHFTVIKKSIVDEIGGFREGLDGSQDHDIILRAIAANNKVHHIPRILYHWRKIPGSTAVAYDSKSYAWEAGRKAIENCLQQRESGIRVEFGNLKGTYRVFREIQNEPLISIIVPFKDKPDLMHSCFNSILDRSTYRNFELLGVNNNSELEETSAAMQHFVDQDDRVRFVDKNIPFNFSAICNFGVEQAKGEFIVLLNNDIEIETPDWLERLLEHAQRDDVGAVGGKLIYPNGRIQHAGVVAGMVGAAGHPHKFFPENHTGYHGRLQMVNNVSAVTGAMMMIKRDKFLQVEGLDADNLAVAYNDIDLCLKLLANGFLNIFTPHCRAIHHESLSRGYEDTDEKMKRLMTEQRHFLSTWQDFLAKGDPYYNPNLSLQNERFSLNFRD